ncbi:MAG: hypothetical protein EAX96_15155 [Candidatus Lokiarchaeota archaeon]|nr:hypothetical protein [Candidatus Lokiarchaeota archaeon]
MGDDSSINGMSIKLFKKMIEELRYDNLIVSEIGTLFIQFYPIKSDEAKVDRLKSWLWNKVNDEMIPKYNEQFKIKLESNNFPTHIEILNLFKLPEVKIKKFFNLFKWVYERL